MSVGTCGATALMTLPEAARVATLSSVVKTGRSASQPSGSVRDQASSHDAARTASAARHASYFGVHSACASAAFLPAARNASRTSSGTKNSGSSGQSQASLVSLTSSAPSGAPCAAALSCLLGEPQPMCVRTAMMDGLAVSALAAVIAASMASTSLPSATFCTCQP